MFSGDEAVMGYLLPARFFVSVVTGSATSPVGIVGRMALKATGGSIRRPGKEADCQHEDQKGMHKAQFSHLKNIARIVSATITPKAVMVRKFVHR